MQNATALPWSEILSIVGSIVSLILASFAIWLSIVFYRLSNDSSTKIKESAERIAGSVDRLESLFDKLYSDTFSMMKDTVSDMRRHIWRDDSTSSSEIETEKRANEKIQQLQEQFQQEATQMLSNKGSTNVSVEKIVDDVKGLLGRAIDESRKAEIRAREDVIKEDILEAIKTQPRESMTLTRISKVLSRYSEPEIVQELFKLAREGALTWDGAPHHLGYDEGVSLTNR